VQASRRYAAARTVWSEQTRWPLYRIDTAGAATRLGTLHALRRGYWYVAFDGDEPCFAHDELRDGLYPDLPWFLLEVRPQGFPGRAFARQHAAELDAGADPERWSADAILASMLRHGDDLPGNLIVGDVALERAHRRIMAPTNAVPEAARAERYGPLARLAMAGESPGSSAGGEQQKFTACVERSDGVLRHVIVKFDGDRLRTLHAFGRLIGNSDMHFGNISLTHLRALPLALVPSYDMLPMRFAPGSTGEVHTPEPELALPRPDEWPAMDRALPIAREFWHRVAADAAVNVTMRHAADQHLAGLRKIAAWPRPGAAISD